MKRPIGFVLTAVLLLQMCGNLGATADESGPAQAADLRYVSTAPDGDISTIPEDQLAPPEPFGQPTPTIPDTCAKDVAAGSKTVTCTAPIPGADNSAEASKGPVDQSGAAAAAAAGTQVTPTCNALQQITWYLGRFEACWRIESTFISYDFPQNGPPVYMGSMDYRRTDSIRLDRTSDTIIYNISISYIRATGIHATGTPLQITADYACGGPCSTAVSSFGPFLLSAANPVFNASAVAHANPLASYASVQLSLDFPAYVRRTGPLAGEGQTAGPGPSPTVRCDKAFPGNNNTTGCVFPDFMPNFSLAANTGTLMDVARHIQAAQGSGLPGATRLKPLHYQYSPTVNYSQQNGAKACPSSLVRPANKTCDEYPFRSTKEGASTGAGTTAQKVGRSFPWCSIPWPQRTGAYGWSSCMVPTTQNSGAGNALQTNLYNPYRIINGDAFTVTITGTYPCAPVAGRSATQNLCDE